MKLLIDIEGVQTQKHCSQSSSINKCQFLKCSNGRCQMFKTKLEYDFDYHAYERCEACRLNGYFEKKNNE